MDRYTLDVFAFFSVMLSFTPKLRK